MKVLLNSDGSVCSTLNLVKSYKLDVETTDERATWGSPREFLLSCISMSVGLGNIWRFPFTAYENGGGAFLIPYLVVLFFIGKPLYFLEMAMGQFSSYGSVKIWEVAPIVKGIGYGQAFATWCVVTYYTSLMALVSFYFIASFQSPLPWTYCDPVWADEKCVDSTMNLTNSSIFGKSESPSDQYFRRNVLQQIENIDDGIGAPEWRLTVCLLFSWTVIFLILAKGVSSSGKAAYFTALFPYVVLLCLLVRGVTLPGAYEGIMFYITPQWDKILEAKVWYAAVTQCFFSLSVSFGPIVMFSSYNNFKRPIYRDSLIITFMDTGTSLLAGVTIFAILGHLAHELDVDITKVVKGGTGLAFISYPDAIGKTDIAPQVFALSFFLMLFTLGVGSASSLAGCVITVINDDFPQWKKWKITAVVSVIGFACGLVYVTPGGQYILDLVDYFGGGFIIFVMAILQTFAVSWIYGYKKLIRDIYFMLGNKLSVYWIIEWGFFIPISLFVIFVYSLFNYEPLKIGDNYMPASATAAGWVLTLIAVSQIPIWAFIAVRKQTGNTLFEKLKNACKPTKEWGPKNPSERQDWVQHCQKNEIDTGDNSLDFYFYQRWYQWNQRHYVVNE
ncbi:sodium-dependent nutrient amino acid transporter 1-like isoform X2 [Artemia franciscana]|uniref:sodium-dependent nutrient amino acid transporter 1-like isoform X2 n=1 Tax=Artemia franciscana TaxID=6661 RepID=UPI0032D9E6BD